MFCKMCGVVAAAEAHRAGSSEPLADRRAAPGPDGLQLVADRGALTKRQRIEHELPVGFARRDEIASLLVVLAGAATAGHDETLVLDKQRRAFAGDLEAA